MFLQLVATYVFCILYCLSPCSCCGEKVYEANVFPETVKVPAIPNCPEWLIIINPLKDEQMILLNISTTGVSMNDEISVNLIKDGNSREVTRITHLNDHEVSGLLSGKILITIHSGLGNITSNVTITFKADDKYTHGDNENTYGPSKTVTVLSNYGGTVRYDVNSQEIVHMWIVDYSGAYDSNAVNFENILHEDVIHHVRLYTVVEGYIKAVNLSVLSSQYYLSYNTIIISVSVSCLHQRLTFSYLSSLIHVTKEVEWRAQYFYLMIPTLLTEHEELKTETQFYQIKMDSHKTDASAVLFLGSDKTNFYGVPPQELKNVVLNDSYVLIAFYEKAKGETSPISNQELYKNEISNVTTGYQACGRYIDNDMGEIDVQYKFNESLPRLCTFIFIEAKGTRLELDLAGVDLSNGGNITISVENDYTHYHHLPYIFLDSNRTSPIRLAGTVTVVHRVPHGVDHLAMKILYSRVLCGGVATNVIIERETEKYLLHEKLCFWYISTDFAKFVRLNISLHSNGLKLLYGDAIFTKAEDGYHSEVVTLQTPVSIVYHKMDYQSSLLIDIAKETDPTGSARNLEIHECFQTIQLDIQPIAIEFDHLQHICLFHVKQYNTMPVNITVNTLGHGIVLFTRNNQTKSNVIKSYRTETTETFTLNESFSIITVAEYGNNITLRSVVISEVTQQPLSDVTTTGALAALTEDDIHEIVSDVMAYMRDNNYTWKPIYHQANRDENK